MQTTPSKEPAGDAATPTLDEFIPLAVAARHWPGRTKPLHTSALYRFANEGRLRVAKIPGSGLCTTWRWIREFALADASPTSPAARRPAAAIRTRRRRTEATLAKHGLAQEPAR